MKMAKKIKVTKNRAIWISVVSAIVVIGLTLGIVFGVRSCNQKPVETGNVEQMLILEDKQEFAVGKPVVFQFYHYNSNKAYVSMSYSINNGADNVMTDVTYGEAKDHKYYNGENIKYYVDSGVQIISTGDMTAGYYTLVIYGITDAGEKVQICESPYIFKLS